MEIIDELKLKLIDPKPYEVKGTYHYIGEENEQVGELFIDKNMDFVGEITDTDWMVARRVVKGKISINPSLIRMKFEKLATDWFVPVHYNLAKPNNKTIIGEYEGMWAFSEKAIISGIGYKPGIGEVATIKNPDQCGEASLKLYEK